MKKKIVSLLLLSSIIAITGCGKKKTNTNDSSSVVSGGNVASNTVVDKDPDGLYVIPDVVRLHYSRLDGNYSNYVFWLWSDQYEPSVETRKDGIDDFGMYVEIDTTEFKKNGETSLWFLVKSAGSWGDKTIDIEIKYENYKSKLEDGKAVMDIYATGLSSTNIELSDFVDTNKGAIVSASFIDKKTVAFKTTHEMSAYKIYAVDREFQLSKNSGIQSAKVVAQGDVRGLEATVTLDDNFKFDFATIYKIYVVYANDVKSGKELAITCNALYKTKEFLDIKYDGDDLGLTFDEKGYPVFKVFAPTTPVVKLNIYARGYTANLEKDVELSASDVALYNNVQYQFTLGLDKNGIHSSELIEDPKWQNVKVMITNGRYYYTYEVDNIAGIHEIVDPYAKATSLNSMRGSIIKLDHDKATPSGWDDLPLKWDGVEGYDITCPQDLVVSENHIRDLTMNETWTNDKEIRKLQGTYKGFSLPGTTYTKDGKTVKTGFDHLEEYGVNAVQLLPIYDADNEDTANKYNWGYDPLNYNIPEGMYSTNPKDPYCRIKELRELVQAYANNKNHTRIIMDVVYNHVSNASASNFEYLIPGYYFRMADDGSYLDGSGCGNEFNSDTPMGQKFIVDSVKHWATTYKIKGFRFDLMGLISTEAMRKVKEALYEIDPDIVIYGEGWDATGAYYGNSAFANSDTVFSKLYSSDTSKGKVGAFNDAGRNAIRGENNGGNGYPGHGVIAQGAADISREKLRNVEDMIRGIHTGKGANPAQVVNYASCHDNYTLFDQLNWTLSSDGGKTAPKMEDVCRASVAVNGTIILSNGISFINGGEELFRSKVEYNENAASTVEMYGKLITHNSYKSGDKTNSYNYANKVDYYDYFDMYKQLIEIRKLLKPIAYPDNTIYDGNEEGKKTLVSTWGTDEGTKLAAYRTGKDGKSYFFFLNGRSSSASFGFGGGTEIFNTGTATTYSNYKVNMNEKYSFSVYVN